MKRFNFPFNYKPAVSLKDTLVYANGLKENIFSFFEAQYKTIYLDPALVVPCKNTYLAYENDDRFVSFDNKANNLISAFNNCQDNYFTLAANKFRRRNICTFAPLIRRDAKLTNTSSMVQWIIDLELAMPEDNLNINYFSSFIQDLYKKILSFCEKPSLQKIHNINPKKKAPRSWKILDARKIERSYPTLSLEQSVNHICSNNRLAIVTNNFKKLKSNKSIEQYVPTAHDLDCSCGLYVYDYANDSTINLINICKRPTGKKSFEQLKSSNPIELENEIYDSKLFDKTRLTNMSITINFTNLLYYLLDKIHLAEVVSSVWTDEFMEFVETEKIEIL